MVFSVINFYKFVALEDLLEIKETHEKLCRGLGILGSILLAPEGINAALGSFNKLALDEYEVFLRSDPRFADMSIAKTEGVTKAFDYFWIKLKDYIVVFDSALNPTIPEIASGPRLSPIEFEQRLLSKDENVIILDTRNSYEVEYGTFKDAESLGIKNFRQFPEAFLKKYKDKKDKVFLMYCTGGIRCKKTVAFAKNQGFENVFQLEGGIINYHKERGNGAFKGNNFVFDKRWAITPNLQESENRTQSEKI